MQLFKLQSMNVFCLCRAADISDPSKVLLNKNLVIYLVKNYFLKFLVKNVAEESAELVYVKRCKIKAFNF